MDTTSHESQPPINTACIGFIGLGLMGGPTVEHMLKLGYTVAVFDIDKTKVEDMESQGAIACISSLEVAQQATCIFTMVPGPKEVNEIYLGIEGVINNLPNKGTYILECSTVGFHAIEKSVTAAEEAGHFFLDCPISGGIQGANAGTLTFMVGGSDASFKAVEPFLSELGKEIIHCGPTGSAQAIKICNNMCFGVNMLAAIEAYKLAEHLGVDLKKFTDVINNSTGSSFVTNIYNPVPHMAKIAPSNNNYEGGYKLKLALKDLHIAQEAAKEVSMDIDILNTTIKIFEGAYKDGLGSLDFSAYYMKK